MTRQVSSFHIMSGYVSHRSDNPQIFVVGELFLDVRGRNAGVRDLHGPATSPVAMYCVVLLQGCVVDWSVLVSALLERSPLRAFRCGLLCTVVTLLFTRLANTCGHHLKVEVRKVWNMCDNPDPDTELDAVAIMGEVWPDHGPEACEACKDQGAMMSL